ncbi:MAG: iron-containing alcohol dehydrogenase [Kiritimatiellae bacterium]|nr:iron-containing alcohol dehydrogenase [Kiritimatiellia bacterium]
MAKKQNDYPVLTTSDLFGKGSDAFLEMLDRIDGRNSKLALIADANVVQYTPDLGTKIGIFLQEKGLKLASAPIVIPGGEKCKNDNGNAERKVVSSLISEKIGRNDIAIAIGGGAVLDVAGYACAQVRGGVRIVRIPTTISGMVDGAFADEAAIDGLGIKDSMHLASIPAAVIIDTLFVRTVLDGVWRGGSGELVRLAAARDATLFKQIEAAAGKIRSHDRDTMIEIVICATQTRVKKGGTKIGKWCSTRLEAMSGFKMPYGYSTAIALGIECLYSVAKGYMKAEDSDRTISLLAQLGALEGLSHSRNLLETGGEAILRGLDAWVLREGNAVRELPAGVGKLCVEENPDLETYRKAIKDFAKIDTGA